MTADVPTADVPAADAHGSGPVAQPWASDRWSLEVRGDELADVRCDGRVALRAIRAVARDEDWATAWPREVRVDAHADTLTLSLEIADLGLELAGTLRVTAEGDRLRVDLDLEARADSSTNRTGLVVLHPPQLAGTPLQVTHPDGGDSETLFPVQVSPHQPARDIAGLAWAADGLPLRLELAGDVFEMEDQRNWTDASFKTYSRPLEEPFPYTLPAGERVRQSLVLTAGARVGGAADANTSAGGDARAGVPEELTWHRGGTVPLIGTGHLDLELADPTWPARLDAALAEALAGTRSGLALWVVYPSPADPSALAELGRRLTAAAAAGAELRFVGIADVARHVTTPELATALRAVLPEAIPVVGGARSHYTELNREWETVLAAGPSALAFATTPLFHTLETEQLIEAVAMQRLLAGQLTARAPGLPVHVGPITLRARFANVATRPQPVPAPAPPLDPRAGSPLHAAWTVASAAALSVAGVTSLTFGDADAFRAGGTADAGAAASARGASPAGQTSPAHDAASPVPALAGLAGRPLSTGRSADSLLWAIGDGETLLLANLSPRPRRVLLPGRDAPVSLDPISWSAL
ncbi:hypothetical protein [Brachybacterium sp. J153]|uniref:hypothetical protein n=1 Tax=Brachybacterium sp. J153 TaxID=3116488 RepID=UPI002E7793C8|nr:hypothetical protein [Brachybacterium sp. J153]MEE1618642.1 hypothetical protein [Brachybacterium sp. J153]